MEVSSVFVALWNDDDVNVDVVLSSSRLPVLPSDDEEENEGDDNDAMGVFVYK
jgi:hypothetical protein